MSSQPVSNQRGRVRELLDDFVQRRAAGEELDDQTLIAAHPELMPTLGHELALLRVMHRAVHRAGPEADSSSAAARWPAPPAAQIRGYRLLREVHRGGQGVVYQAIQESTGQTVAIKVMREGPFAGKSDRARFEREVAILARLKHPNIVTIHDKGIAGGATYFVMDYIDGPPLDQWISEPPTPVGGDIRTSSRFSPRETPRPRHGGSATCGRGSDARHDAQPIGNRKPATAGRSEIGNILRLFAKICDAVHAAHLRGIIHRDLKPSNIRIDREGEPHVLDFGLAKEISEAGAGSMTADGQFVGSLPWASPEQVRGAGVDVRTDVYSLGVIVFQCLTGAMPYEVRGPMGQVIERITSATPTSPRVLGRQVDPDLEIIVLRCLAKEPERRYQSAGELAGDIRHYLAGEAIEARRDSAVYVLLKNARRYRWALASAGAFVLLLAGFGAYAWHEADRYQRLGRLEHTARQDAELSAVSERIAKEVAQSATEQERSAKQTAQAATEQARIAREAEASQREAAESQARRAQSVTSFLINTLGLADPDVTQAPDMTMKSMLDHAAEQVGTAFTGQPASEAQVRLVIGRAYASLGELDAAREHLARAVALHESVLASNSAELYEALWSYVHVLDELGDDDWRTHWRKLWALYPLLFQSSYSALAASLGELRGPLVDARDPQGISERYADLQRVAMESLKPDDPHWLTLADFLHLGGGNLAYRQIPQSGCPLLREALAIERRFLPETHTRIIRTLGELVRASIEAGLYEEAEGLTRESLELVRHKLPEGHWYLAVYQARLGACLAGQGQFDQAERLLLENLQHIESARGRDNLFVREILERLIELYEARGMPDVADQWRDAFAARVVGSDQYYRPLPQVKCMFGPRHADLYDALERLRRERQPNRMTEALNELLALRQAQLADDHVLAALLAECLCSVGNGQVNRIRPNEQTLAMQREAERIARAGHHLHPRKQAWIYWNLARNLEPRAEGLTDAERLAREALAILQTRYPDRDSLVLDVRGSLGGFLLKQKRYEEAEGLLAAVCHDRLAANGPTSRSEPDLARLLTLYQETGRAGAGLSEAFAVSRGHRPDWRTIRSLVAAHYPTLAQAIDTLRGIPGGEIDRIAAAIQEVVEARRAAFKVSDPMALVYGGALIRVARPDVGRTFDPVWLPVFQEVADIELAHFPADQARIGNVLWWVAVLLNRQGDYVQAERFARQSRRILQIEHPEEPEIYGTRDSTIAGALLGQGRSSEGEALLRAACPSIASADRMFEPYGSEAFRYFLNFWALTGRGTEARDLAAPILRGELARRSDARLLCRLAERVVWQGGFDQELYSLALEAAQAAHDLLPRDQHIPLIVACAHHRLGDYEEADRWFEQLTRPSQRDALVRGAFMAMNDSRLGQSQAAREALQRLQTAVQARAVPVTPDERTLLAEAEHMLASP